MKPCALRKAIALNRPLTAVPALGHTDLLSSLPSTLLLATRDSGFSNLKWGDVEAGGPHTTPSPKPGGRGLQVMGGLEDPALSEAGL